VSSEDAAKAEPPPPPQPPHVPLQPPPPAPALTKSAINKSPPTRLRRWAIQLPLAITALAILVAAIWWFTRAPLVAATSIALTDIVQTLQFSARVATTSRVEVGSTLTGRVVDVAVREGAQVKRGATLIRLESDELLAVMMQAKATESQVAAKLAGLRTTGRLSVNANVAQADSVLFTANADLARTKDLVARGFLSEAKLDEVMRSVKVAQAQQTSARAAQSANADLGSDILEVRAALLLASAATAAASSRLSQTLVLAPADAKVLARLVEPGQIVQPGRALMSLALQSPTQLIAQVDERFLEQLRVGQPASVLADAFPNVRFMARVQSISPLVDTQRGAVEIKFTLPEAPPEFLREDMTLSVEVETGRRTSVLVVPVSALHALDKLQEIHLQQMDKGAIAANEAVVLVEKNGKAEARRITVGLRTLDAAEVTSGLVAGDIVLLDAKFVAGKRVRAKIIADGEIESGMAGKPASAFPAKLKAKSADVSQVVGQ
jgi:HlyD family secretion protein